MIYLFLVNCQPLYFAAPSVIGARNDECFHRCLMIGWNLMYCFYYRDSHYSLFIYFVSFLLGLVLFSNSVLFRHFMNDGWSKENYRVIFSLISWFLRGPPSVVRQWMRAELRANQTHDTRNAECGQMMCRSSQSIWILWNIAAGTCPFLSLSLSLSLNIFFLSFFYCFVLFFFVISLRD